MPLYSYAKHSMSERLVVLVNAGDESVTLSDQGFATRGCLVGKLKRNERLGTGHLKVR